jgi:hypothetical protein
VVALKQVTIDRDLNAIMHEISVLESCNSSSIIALYGFFVDESVLWIVMEYCEAGSISDVVRFIGRTLSEQQIAHVVKDTLLGLDYLHTNSKIHRDIKAGNILVCANGKGKLADFGVAGQLSDAATKRKTVIGTPYWMAPEVIQEVGYTTKADIWSVGITCIELADGQPPLHNIHPMRAIFMIPTQPPPKLSNESMWSLQFRTFVGKCLTKDPDLRPSAAELLSDPFLKSATALNIKIMSDLATEAIQILEDYKKRGVSVVSDKSITDEREESNNSKNVIDQVSGNAAAADNDVQAADESSRGQLLLTMKPGRLWGQGGTFRISSNSMKGAVSFLDMEGDSGVMSLIKDAESLEINSPALSLIELAEKTSPTMAVVPSRNITRATPHFKESYPVPGLQGIPERPERSANRTGLGRGAGNVKVPVETSRLGFVPTPRRPSGDRHFLTYENPASQENHSTPLQRGFPPRNTPEEVIIGPKPPPRRPSLDGRPATGSIQSRYLNGNNLSRSSPSINLLDERSTNFPNERYGPSPFQNVPHIIADQGGPRRASESDSPTDQTIARDPRQFQDDRAPQYRMRHASSPHIYNGNTPPSQFINSGNHSKPYPPSTRKSQSSLFSSPGQEGQRNIIQFEKRDDSLRNLRHLVQGGVVGGPSASNLEQNVSRPPLPSSPSLRSIDLPSGLSNPTYGPSILTLESSHPRAIPHPNAEFYPEPLSRSPYSRPYPGGMISAPQVPPRQLFNNDTMSHDHHLQYTNDGETYGQPRHNYISREGEPIASVPIRKGPPHLPPGGGQMGYHPGAPPHTNSRSGYL